jgi:hypothetical protein
MDISSAEKDIIHASNGTSRLFLPVSVCAVLPSPIPGGLRSCQGRAAPLGWRESAPNPAMPDDFRFDVFLSHSSKDKPVVSKIVERLKKP